MDIRKRLLLLSGKKKAAVPWYLAGGVDAANCVTAYQAIGAASQAASYVNIVAPGTHDITATTAPTWESASGWAFNGSDQYLITDIVPTQNYTMMFMFSDVTQVNQAMIGVRSNSSDSFYMIHPNRSDGVGWRYGVSTVNSAPGLAAGVLAIAGNIGYRNGVADTTAMTWGGTLSHPIFIGAYNNAGAPVFAAPSGKIQAVAIYSIALSAPQILAISNTMAALP